MKKNNDIKILTIKEIQELQLELMKKVHSFLQEHEITYYMLGGSALGAVRHQGFIPWDDDIDIGMFRNDYEKFINFIGEFDKKYSVLNFKNAKNCDYALTRIYIPNTRVDNKIIEKTKLEKRLYFDIFPLDNVPENADVRAKYEKQIYGKKMLMARIDARDNGNSKITMLIKNLISFALSPFRNCILKSTDRLMKKYDNIETSLICSLHSQYSFKKQVMPKEIYGTPVLYKFEDSAFYLPEKAEEYLTILYGKDFMEVPPKNKRRPIPTVYLTDKD